MPDREPELVECACTWEHVSGQRYRVYTCPLHLEAGFRVTDRIHDIADLIDQATDEAYCDGRDRERQRCIDLMMRALRRINKAEAAKGENADLERVGSIAGVLMAVKGQIEDGDPCDV